MTKKQSGGRNFDNDVAIARSFAKPRADHPDLVIAKLIPIDGDTAASTGKYGNQLYFTTDGFIIWTEPKLLAEQK